MPMYPGCLKDKQNAERRAQRDAVIMAAGARLATLARKLVRESRRVGANNAVAGGVAVYEMPAGVVAAIAEAVDRYDSSMRGKAE